MEKANNSGGKVVVVVAYGHANITSYLHKGERCWLTVDKLQGLQGMDQTASVFGSTVPSSAQGGDIKSL